MRTLQQVRDRYAKRLGFKNWFSLVDRATFKMRDDYNDAAAKEYAEEAAKQTLKNVYARVMAASQESPESAERALSSLENIPKLN